ncbi:pilus assembly protein PilM [Alkalihalophilus lindianensis]|uniref:Pilus assembly protein PilM n=1 Tax=Alkalihalophilus lindianensis TaxID=1630542 RepID=A0ABU3XAH3_9BACI|nr:pilus assembly protein PilM [Alkalihalophilus lindianensis]MDV2684895.1 pilus assembly protein PilM [Alkalihalophilus lindianensis]
MNLFQQVKQKRHALIIKDHVIRYISSKQPELHTITNIQERYLPPGVIVNGQIEDEATYLTILSECVENWKLKRQSVQFCLPSQHTIVRTHLIDGTIPDDEVKGQLYLDLGESLLLPFDDPIFDYKVIGLKNGQKEVLLFASRESILHQYLDAFADVHLKPNAAELSTLAAYRLFYELDHTASEAYLIQVQVDTLLTTITIFKDHHPLFLSTVVPDMDREGWVQKEHAEGTQLIWSQKEEQLDEQVQELYREIEKVINFYQFNVLKGEGEISQMLLCGDHPHLLQFQQTFQQLFTLKVTSIEQHTKQDPPPRYYDAVGLALKKEVYG